MKKLLLLAFSIFLFCSGLEYFAIREPSYYLDKIFELNFTQDEKLKFIYNPYSKYLKWGVNHSSTSLQKNSLLRYIALADQTLIFSKYDFHPMESQKKTLILEVNQQNNKASKYLEMKKSLPGDLLDNLLVVLEYCLLLKVKDIVWFSNGRPSRGELDIRKFMDFSLRCLENGIRVHSIEISSQSNGDLQKKVSELSKGKHFSFRDKKIDRFLKDGYLLSGSMIISLCDSLHSHCQVISYNEIDLQKFNVAHKNVYSLLKVEKDYKSYMFELY
ncbi:hypothetical protein MJH12_06910 [bacterium]|nr:hypothetical protein [bacterium]